MNGEILPSRSVFRGVTLNVNLILNLQVVYRSRNTGRPMVCSVRIPIVMRQWEHVGMKVKRVSVHS